MTPDLVHDFLDGLLTAVVDWLDTIGAPVCRSFVAPGASAPWDTCCECDVGEGQAWVLASRVFPVDPFPNQDVSAQRCKPREYAANVTAGVLRCAHTVDDQGVPPDPEVVTADAVKVGRDRTAVLDAIVCHVAGDEPGTFQVGDWTPLGPQGGCVGGQWTMTVAVSACRCPDLFTDEFTETF